MAENWLLVCAEASNKPLSEQGFFYCVWPKPSRSSDLAMETDKWKNNGWSDYGEGSVQNHRLLHLPHPLFM